MADIYKVYVQAIGGGSPEIRECDSMQPALADFERSCCPQNTLVHLLHVTPETTHVQLVWSTSDEEAN